MSAKKKKNLPLDVIAEKIAALGIPALVLVVAIATTGLAGGAAIVAALAVLGGPLGMLGGLAMLGVLTLISRGLARFGLDRLFEAVVMNLRSKGHTDEEIRRKIERYPIGRRLKRRLFELLEQTATA